MNATFWMILIFFIISIAIGLVASLIGIGGGVLIIPVLIFLFGFPIKDAIFISLFAMTGLTISASISYVQEKYVNFRLAFLYESLSIPGVIIGSLISSMLFEDLLAGFCGIVMIIIAVALMRADKKEKMECTVGSEEISKDWGKGDYEAQEEEKIEKITAGADPNKKDKKYEEFGIDNLKAASVSSISGGVIAGMIGVGGGTIKVSSMHLCGVEPKTAVGTSEFSMSFTAVFAVFFHLFLGNFHGIFLWPILMCLGAIIGAQIGVYACKRIQSNLVQKIFSVIVFYSGVIMIILLFDIGWV